MPSSFFGVRMAALALAMFCSHAAAWNIADLHHEDGVPLRDRSSARDAEDFERLKTYVTRNAWDIVAIQEAGSPQAIARIFPEDEYHIAISGRYTPGLEDTNDRDIFTAYVFRKSKFPDMPSVETLDALAIRNIDIRNGKPTNFYTRAGMIADLEIGEQTIRMLNVHLKSSCHEWSLHPVQDENRNSGDDFNSRFDCRTLKAQNLILESWIEQQQFLGHEIVILGDFNRRFNRFDDLPAADRRVDHFWSEIDDGTPNGLALARGPLGKNTTCWADHLADGSTKHGLYREEHIDFVVFSSGLEDVINAADIEKISLPDEELGRYSGDTQREDRHNGKRLSDHCPVVFSIMVD